MIDRRTEEEKRNLYTQRSAKQLLLQEIENGANSSSKIEERLMNYKTTAIECYLKGMIEGEKLSTKIVYSFINFWFHSINEYLI